VTRHIRSAYQTALDLLARRDHFRHELAEKLQRRGHGEDEVREALARCADAGLLDDERLAARFVELRAADRGWGPHRLAAELRRRGVPTAAAERAAVASPALVAGSLATALRKLEAQAPAGWWRDGRRRARMLSSLVTRGFDAEAAIAAVDELAATRESTHHELDDE
jgi:regulatory protein